MGRALTPKQEKALALYQRALQGEITVEEALTQAGYAPSSARQQKEVIDSLRRNSAMQDALRQAEVTEVRIAKKVSSGIDSKSDKVALGFTKLAAELLDAFPAQKTITAEVGVEALLDEQEDSADYALGEKP